MARKLRREEVLDTISDVLNDCIRGLSEEDERATASLIYNRLDAECVIDHEEVEG